MKYAIVLLSLLTACASTPKVPVRDLKGEAAIEAVLKIVIANINALESHMIPEFQIFFAQKCVENKSDLCKELVAHLQDDADERANLYERLHQESKKLNELVLSGQ